MKFWRAVPVFLGALLALSCGASPPRNEVPQPAEIQSALDATVVLLYHGWATGDLALVCAGEYITPNVIATAYHCLDSATGCPEKDDACFKQKPVGFMRDWDTDQVSLGSVLAADVYVDLALILTTDAGPPVPMNIELPAVGERLFSIGHPRGAVNTIAEGYVKESLVLTPEPAVAMNIAIGPGSSGGGLYNYKGELVGVCSAMSLDGTTGYFIPANQAWRLLSEAGLF